MNELVTNKTGLPANIQEVAKEVLIGRERLDAIRAAIKAAKKVNKPTYDAMRTEGREYGERILDYELILKEYFASLEKGSGRPSKIFDTAVENKKPSKMQAVNELGFSQKEVERIQQLTPEAVEKAIAIARENNDIPTRSLALQIVKQEKKEEKEAVRQAEIKAQSKQKAKIPTDNYSCIVIDPPWNYGTQYDTNGRRAANPYPEMSFDQIAELKIKAKPDCIMFLWTTHKFIWDAKKLLEKWGFEYRSIIVWDKEKMGMGDLFRMQCEFCLVGIKGKPLLNNPHNIRDIIKEPRREHSRKPEAFYKIVDTLYKGEKLEYFAREQRDGYAVYGNDTNKF